MTLDEFKQLKKGDVVQYLNQAPMYIQIVDRQYKHEQPYNIATLHTLEIVTHTGQTLKASDPIEWIKNTRLLPDYKGDCPNCGKFDLIEQRLLTSVAAKPILHCPACSYIAKKD